MDAAFRLIAAHGASFRSSGHRFAGAEPEIPVLLAKAEGSVVATMNDTHVAGRKFLLVRPQFVDDRSLARFGAGGDSIVAVDTVGAGVDEMVVICQGSPARLAPDLVEAPVDAVVMGIVDVVDVRGHQVYSRKT